MFRNPVPLVSVLLPALACVSLASATPHYVITDIGVLPGDTSSAAYGVNDSGQVVGLSTSSAGPESAVLYSGGSLTNLIATGIYTYAYAMGINDSGAAVLTVSTSPNGIPKFGYIYAGGTAIDLRFQVGVLSGIPNQVWAISSAGQVTGDYGPATGTQATFFYSGGTTGTSINIENGQSVFSDTCGYGINNLGAVVGSGWAYGAGLEFPFIWSPTTGIQAASAMMPGTADGVNDSGVVVGSTGNGGWHGGGQYVPAAAFVSTPTASGYVATLLPSLGNGSTDGAYGISDTGLIVGESAGNAFLAAQSGGAWRTTNLNSLVNPAAGWTLKIAEAISNDGSYIAGIGTINGQSHGFELELAIGGDANLDGTVDVNDLTVVLSNFGRTGMTWTTGDFNGDGRVDVNDLTILLSQFGESLGSSAAMAPVPEPASLLLLVATGTVGLLVCAGRRRRRLSNNCATTDTLQLTTEKKGESSMFRHSLVIVLFLSLSLPFAPAASAVPHYVVTDIGVLPGDTTSAAYGVNDSGQVAGLSTSSTGPKSAVLYSGGSLTDITPPGGTGAAAAVAINDSGAALITLTVGIVQFGYVYGGGMAFGLNGQPGVLYSSPNQVWAINNAEQVTGCYGPSSGRSAAFFYSGGTSGSSTNIEFAETMFYDTCGYGINNLAQLSETVGCRAPAL